MAVKCTSNPPGTADLVSRLEALRSVLYWDRPGMQLEETVQAATEELGGTQEALVRLLTLCVTSLCGRSKCWQTHSTAYSSCRQTPGQVKPVLQIHLPDEDVIQLCFVGHSGGSWRNPHFICVH